MAVHQANPRALISIALPLLLTVSAAVCAGPPDVPSFEREQRLQYNPKAGALLRIWVVYVQQGDAIFIEFPRGAAASLDAKGLLRGDGDPVEMLIDGGALPPNESDRLAAFLKELRPAAFNLDFGVISHHDQDHAEGIIRLLEHQKSVAASQRISFGTIFHNGLASYAGGKRDFPTDHRPPNSISEGDAKRFKRGMAFLQPAPPPEPALLTAKHIINNLVDLEDGVRANDFQGVYRRLANAVVEAQPAVKGFERAFFGHAPLDIPVPDAGAMHAPANVHIEFVWPRENPRRYAQWSETINGNSVALHLTYGEFTMYFTGDMNSRSEQDQINLLRSKGRMDILDADVLKVPHHGSEDGVHEFFAVEQPNETNPKKRWKSRPVVSVASMGVNGFETKFQHPRTEIIDWLGGAHRVYHTHIHEKKFDYTTLTTEAAFQKMTEGSHILIETDGEFFRVAEIHEKVGSIKVPEVIHVRRGDGTRWIRAAKGS